MGKRDMTPLRLSVLDFGFVYPDYPAERSLADTVAMIKRAEELGCARFWIGEHHLQRHAYGSPQVLAAVLGAVTRRIRIGVGAMLLQYWSPLKLAEDFRLLEALFRRVDLGVGRGRADNTRSHRALLDGRDVGDGMLGAREYSEKLDELLAHLHGTLSPKHPHWGAAVIPEVDATPDVWVCGSETAGPEAARTGTRFCCTLFHKHVVGPEHIARYRQAFRPSAHLDEPEAAIAVCGVCTETDAEAQAIREWFPHPNYLPNVVGTPERCKATLDELRTAYDVDEVVFLDMAPDGATRRKSLELLAQALAVAPVQPAADA